MCGADIVAPDPMDLETNRGVRDRPRTKSKKDSAHIGAGLTVAHLGMHTAGSVHSLLDRRVSLPVQYNR